MPYVAIQPAAGLGNQLFMMAAALGYAELHGLTPVFWDTPSSSWEHQGSAFRIREMFPHIRVLTADERATLPWQHVKESPENTFTYQPIPPPQQPDLNVRLEGYFQSDLYGPSTFPAVPPPSSPLHPTLIAHEWSRTFFLHVRRGDYLHPANAHHAVDLRAYWRTCLETIPKDATCFVVSDDIAWCKENLGAIVGSATILWCPETITDIETFFWMTACELGGITANSSFSWWAAWYGKRLHGAKARYWIPRHWGTPPLPPTRHLHPAWATVV